MILDVEDWDGKQTNVIITGPMESVIKKMKLKPTVIITSPPYGVGKIPRKRGTPKRQIRSENQRYDETVDNFTEAQYLEWLSLCMNCSPLVFWNVPAKQQRPFGTDMLKPFGQIIWTKAQGTIPFGVKGVIYAHEYIWLLGNHKLLKKQIYSVWNFAAQRYSKHPAPFPIQLPAKAIEASTSEGDIVFDPFGGSGTTICAAELMKRRWLMCDESLEYCKWAEERLNETIKRRSRKEDSGEIHEGGDRRAERRSDSSST